MDRLNELYVGNERDFVNRNVMLAVDGVAHDCSDIVMFAGKLTLCDRSSAEDGVVEFVHVFVDKDGNETKRVKEGGAI